MRTSDPRVKVENYGPGNWRTVARDDCGDWAITGPPYPTRAEALVNVPAVVHDYFGEPATVAPGPGKVPAAVVVDAHDGYTFWRGADGELFTPATAQAFADARNAEMKPEHALYGVYLLTPTRTSRR